MLENNIYNINREFDYPPLNMSNGDFPVALEAVGGGGDGDGGETGAAVVGGSDGAVETAGGVAGIGIFKQGVGISILGPGTSEQRINDVTIPYIGRPPK